MKRIVLLIVTITITAHTISQSADTTRNSRFSLRADFEYFFKDNEFSAEKTSGYTIPGFYFRPRLVWNVEKHVRLEAGVHWLHYWGASSYPRNISFTAFPEMGEESAPSHVLPWMQARVDVLPQLSLVFGNLYNNDKHLQLPRPLYDDELLYATDPEAGIQMLLNFKYFNADIWADWRNFIFRGSETQERFICGFSGRVKPIQTNVVNLSLPIHAIVQHTGGEMVAVSCATISMFNFSAGLQLGLRMGKVEVTTGCHAVAFINSGDTTLSFKNGWGIYPHLGAKFAGVSMDVAYWHGDNFVPLLGSPHFSNVSVKKTGLVFDPMDMLCASVGYELKKFRHTTLAVEGLTYIYFPYSGTFGDFTRIEKDGAASFAFGFFLKVNPKIAPHGFYDILRKKRK